MPNYSIQGPDGKTYSIDGPEGASREDVIDAIQSRMAEQAQAQKEHEAKTGFVQSVKSGWHGALGSTEDWLGRTTGSEGLKQAGQANLQKSATEHEATTAEDVSRAQGILPTVGKAFSKYVGEPIGGAIGSFGAPVAAGIATSFAAPEIAILGGLMDTASIAAATTAYPMIAGQMMERQEQQTPGEPANMVKANLMAVPASLLFAFKKIPGVDQIAQKLAPSIEAQVAELTPKILGGDITLEAAKKELTSKTGLALKEFGLTTAHASAVMGGSEELTRAQAGQESMTPQEWMETIGTGALFGGLHAPFRGEAGKVAAGEQKLTAADTHIKNEFAKMRDLAAQRELTKEENAKLAELDAEAKRVAEKEAYYKQLTQQDVLPLSSSIEQAKEVQTEASPQGDLFAGAAPTTEAPKAEVVTRKMLNEIGVGPTAKVHKAILGLDINDPKQNEIIQNKLEAHFEKYGPKEGNADKVDAFMNNLKKIGGQDVTKSRLDTESNREGVQSVNQPELGGTRGIAESDTSTMDNDRDLSGQYTEGARQQRDTLEKAPEVKPAIEPKATEVVKEEAPVVEEPMPLQDEARKVASQLKAFDPEHPKIEVLKDVDVTEQDLNEAKAELASLKETRAAKGVTPLAEEKEVAKAAQLAKPSEEPIPNTGRTKDDIIGEIKGLVGSDALKAIDRGDLKVISSAEIPKEANVPANAPAFYHEGVAHLIHDRLKEGEALPNLHHETGVHYGLENMVGSKVYQDILKRFENLNGKDQRVTDAHAHVDKNYPELKPGSKEYMEEVVARIGETAPNHPLWKRILTAVKTFLMKKGFTKADTLNVDQLHALVNRSLRESLAGKLEATEKAKTQFARTEVPKFRADGTAIKYVPEHKKGFIESVKEPFHGGAPLWRSLSDKLANKVVSKYSSVKNKLFDANIPAVSSKIDGQMRADLIALNSDLAVGTTQAALLQGKLVIEKSGMPMAQKGEVNITDVSKGFKDLLDKATSELGDADLAYDMVSAGWVGPRYEQLKAKNEAIEARIEKLKEGKKGNWAAKVRAAEKEKAYVEDWDASDQATYEEAKRRFGPELDNLRDMRNKMREPLIKALVDSHRLDAETAKEWIDNIDYVPFYRVPAEEMMDKQGRPITIGSGLLNVGRNYKLKGSKRAVADPMDNFINNMEYWTQAAIKNNAAVRLADTLVNLGAAKYAERKLTAGESKNNYWVPIYKDGVEKQLILADPNDMAAFSAAPILQGLVWNIARKGTSLLRHGITMMPQFVYNQALEDPVRATLVSGNKAGFVSNLTGTVKSVWKNQFTSEHTEGADVLNRAGLIGQKDFMTSEDIKNRYSGTDKEGYKKGLLFFERLAQGSDLGARETIYNNAMKELKAEGYDETTARALAITRATEYMPHQQIGTSRSLAYLRAMMPFVNAPIQGLARDVAAARGRLSGVDKAQGQKMLMWRIGKYAAFTAIYSAFNSGNPEYESQTEDQKDNYFFIGGTRIPAPQEIRPLKALIERGTRAWVLNAKEADIENSDIAAAVIKKSWEIISGLAVPIPAAVRPGLENVINYDFFSKHPIVGAGKIHDEPFMQYTDTTSELAKAVGAALNVSPLKVDHLLSGYFGYMGQTVEKFSNALVEGRPTQNVNDWMFVGSMVQNPYGSGPKTEAYELLDKATQVKATIKDLKAAGKIDELKDYMKKNKGYVQGATAINDLHTKITNIRRLQTQITQSNMPAEEKRARIDKLKQNELMALSHVHDIHRKIIEINDR